MDSMAKSSSSVPTGRLVGLQHHLVARGVGDGAARGERGQPRAAPAPQPPVTASRCSCAPSGPAAWRCPPPACPPPRRSRARARSAYGAARRTRAKSASSSCSSHAQMATICWARTSSGASPQSEAVELRRAGPRATSAAHSTSSSRVSGKSRPLGVAPRAWPERPTRWSAVAMERGEPSWQVRSTVPTSMPSSSEAVATTSAQLARLEPLLGVEAPRPAEAAVVRGHALRAQALGQVRGPRARPAARVDEDQRGAVLAGELAPPGRRSPPTARWCRPRPARRASTSMARSMSRRWPTSTISGSGRAAPTRSRAAVSTGRTVAERPMRCSGAGPAARRPGPRAARGRAPGARRACRPPPRGSRPR